MTDICRTQLSASPWKQIHIRWDHLCHKILWSMKMEKTPSKPLILSLYAMWKNRSKTTRPSVFTLGHPHLQNKISTKTNIYHTVTHLWKSFFRKLFGSGWHPIDNTLLIVAEKVMKSRFFSWNNLKICGDIIVYNCIIDDEF